MNSEKIDYESVLADLEAQKDGIQAAIDGIKQMLGKADNGVGGVKTPSKPARGFEFQSDTFFGLSIPEGTKKLLAIRRKALTSTQIADTLKNYGITTTSKNFANNVNSVLYRYTKESGDIVRVPNSKEWGLREWYPGLKSSQGQRAKPSDAGSKPPDVPDATPNEDNPEG